MPHQSGKPDWTGGNPGLNPGRGGGGKPDGAGSKKGELFGDQLILLRDLDTADGGGNGEPVLDPYNTEGQIVVVGYDPTLVLGGDDGLFPIYLEQDAEGDYEIPLELQPYVQEVELERANVARAPDKVQEKALAAALEKITTADTITTDPAGRIMYSTDGGVTFLTIDAPLENLALYQYLMTNGDGSPGAWPDVTQNWDPVFQALLGDDLTDPDWDPSALIGAAWSKEGEITLDALIYENTTLGVNQVSGSGETLQITYFDFSDPGGELYDYDRAETYSDTWLRWIEIEDGQPVFKYGTVYDAVFGGEPWDDTYLVIDPGVDPLDPSDDEFVLVGATLSGVNDFAAAADDSRAVIEFIHRTSAVEVDVSEVPPELLDGPAPVAKLSTVAVAEDTSLAADDGHDGHDDGHDGGDHSAESVTGTNKSDTISTGGGPQEIEGLNGSDEIHAGGGPDIVYGGNGRDSLYGEGGPDMLFGGNGPDILVGGPSMDTLTGGLGPDSFVFNAPSDVPGHGPCDEGRRETITDFQPGDDVIDFSAMNLILGLSDAPTAFHAWTEQVGADTVLYVDTDGNLAGAHPAEMGIVLSDLQMSALSEDDFLF